jgi:hypothetical protein
MITEQLNEIYDKTESDEAIELMKAVQTELTGMSLLV